MRVNIIGGGLAGCALAYTLRQAGAEPVIYEAGNSLASGASGNDVGLYNPRFTAEYDAAGAFYSIAFFEALALFTLFGDVIDWKPCGALHLITDEKKARRFPKTVKNWQWGATTLSGVEIDCDALFLAKSGIISPKKLCHAYARDVDVHLNTSVPDAGVLEGGVTILACGMGCAKFKEGAHLPLRPVRGQITYAEETAESQALKTTIGYGGYVAPSFGGVHCVGSTFQRWMDHSDLMSGDDLSNLSKLSESVPSLSTVCNTKNSRASIRTAARDHFPVVGQLGEGVYISTAHGSHGILSSLLSAKIITNTIFQGQPLVSEGVMKALSPARFE